MANKAYQVTVRRLTNGCDYHMRLFAGNAEQATNRALDRVRRSDKFTRGKIAELSAIGVAVYRVVSCEVSPDQSRPVG